MSVETFDALSAAVKAHVAEATGGDVVVGFALVAGIIEAGCDSRTAFLTTSPLSRYEIRGLLAEGRVILDDPGARARQEGEDA